MKRLLLSTISAIALMVPAVALASGHRDADEFRIVVGSAVKTSLIPARNCYPLHGPTP